MIEFFIKETANTLLLTFMSCLIAFIFGGLLGIILVLIKKGGLKENVFLYQILDWLVNLFRSIPFIILMLFLMPFTRMLVSTTIGVWGTVVPLAIAAIPFVARLTENAINEVDENLIEMAKSLGASPKQILWNVLLVESRPLLIQQATMALVTILSYGAMAGFVGGGGLGVIAINYGYYRNQKETMIIAIILLIILVQIIELSGKKFSNKINKRK